MESLIFKAWFDLVQLNGIFESLYWLGLQPKVIWFSSCGHWGHLEHSDILVPFRILDALATLNTLVTLDIFSHFGHFGQLGHCVFWSFGPCIFWSL